MFKSDLNGNYKCYTTVPIFCKSQNLFSKFRITEQISVTCFSVWKKTKLGYFSRWSCVLGEQSKILFSGYCRLYFRLRAALLCCFRCFTTCFGLHGHLQLSRIFYFHMLGGFCFAAFFLLLFHVVTLCMFQFVFFSSVFLRYCCCFLACVFV
jgi:hypothetical protein